MAAPRFLVDIRTQRESECVALQVLTFRRTPLSMSFYIPDALRAWINEEVRRTEKSKTQIIVDTLEEARRRIRE
ncbi:MAG: hypothetical protein ACREDR_00015 [Blastocatellia bacterium]